MPYKSILLLFVAVNCAGFAQSGSLSPSQKEVINKLESQPPATSGQPSTGNAKPKSNGPITTPKSQESRGRDPMLGNITSAALNQRVAPATALSNEELLVRGKTIYVVTHSFSSRKNNSSGPDQSQGIGGLGLSRSG